MNNLARKATVAQVKVGPLEFEGLKFEDDGSFAIAIQQIVELNLVPPNRSLKQLEVLLGIRFQSHQKAQTKLNPKSVNTIGLLDLEQLIVELTIAANPEAIKLTRALVGLSWTQLFSDAFNLKFEKADRQKYLVDRILDKPSPWVKLYDKDFCRQVYAWFGPSFYWQFCYFYLTPVERCKVEMVNPIVNGTRKYRIHQHLDSDTRSRIEPYIWQLIPIVDLADGDKDKFMENYRRYFGHIEQLSFLDQLQ